MASKSIDIIISTVLKKTGIDAARAAMKNLASSVGKNLTNIKSAFDMAAASMRTFVSAMLKGMEFERMTTQFKSLTGSMDLARAHMKDLQDLGRTPPFSLEEFAAASQAMMKMTGGMAGFKKEMEIVGDLAAATGNDIATVGRAFGLAYQVIRDGQDFGRAGQQLYSLGIMTKAQVAEFAELSKAGEDNAAVWEKLQEVFGRYKGAMAETEKTTKGIIEAIQGEATVAMTDFSAAISESAKPALEDLLGYLKRINEDGTIESWADRASEAISDLIENFRELKNAMNGAKEGPQKDKFDKSGKSNLTTFLGNTLAGLGSIGAGAVEWAKGGNFGDAQLAYMALHGYGEEADRAARMLNESKKDKGEWIEDIDIRDAQEEDRKTNAKNKKERRAEEKAKTDAEAEKRKANDQAPAQKKKDDERRAANFDEYRASGSTDTFDKWLEDKATAEAKALKDAKTEYAKYLKDAGIAELTADEIDASDAAFKKWRDKQEKKLAQEIADAKKAADAKAAAEKKAEDEAHKQRIDNINAEIKARTEAAQAAKEAKESVVANAQTEFDKAFAMYRSEDKGAAQIAEERDYAADYKQLQKDAARYGGKWRIDELSSLIAAGDTQGQQAKLEEWRKSSRFTPEVESMVRAAAADKTKTTAEDELRKISNNTEGLAKKLDELLAMK